MTKTEEIRVRWESLLGAYPNDTFCNVAQQDIKYLLDKIEAMQKVVDAAEEWGNEPCDDLSLDLSIAVMEYTNGKSE